MSSHFPFFSRILFFSEISRRFQRNFYRWCTWFRRTKRYCWIDLCERRRRQPWRICRRDVEPQRCPFPIRKVKTGVRCTVVFRFRCWSRCDPAIDIVYLLLNITIFSKIFWRFFWGYFGDILPEYCAPADSATIASFSLISRTICLSAVDFSEIPRSDRSRPRKSVRSRPARSNLPTACAKVYPSKIGTVCETPSPASNTIPVTCQTFSSWNFKLKFFQVEPVVLPEA